MSSILDDLNRCPEVLTKEKFCRVCHISNPTGAYLLNSGLVPSVRYGPGNRYYQIKKSDIMEYLNKRQKDRRYYQTPADASGHSKREQQAFSTLQSLDMTPKTRKALQKWLTAQLSDYPDILTKAILQELTGYNVKTILRWNAEGRLGGFVFKKKLLVSKTVMITFLSSDDYNAINRKSATHYKMMLAFLCGSAFPPIDVKQ